VSIGQDEDTKAFDGVILYLGERTKTGIPPHWVRRLRIAFDAGMERGQEKRGCCSENPGANAGCCPDSVGRDA
jgi:hypothetical protein